ncbi:hypothetical protein I3760_10G071800 [Carya illinoinensis]|uniref:B-like cyclin n=1 Tax=Carya illinoinensis TaxID=32201 RepID=A0A8T1PBI4_CARIL|nr:hypothetical protein I3760_10G071800 [Carya illinoinensis]KAG2684328.1 hypothetical protein I3760_10G071800 [Carya illinoinensis]KAG2684329.1 hypothetical protein I3760_10G071800 [Carya illinoinensis]KAG6639031.1 hypothetical protein CIPAW_10G072400 [Carya illinoinensis]
MRGILVDWLVDIAKEYKLLPDTLYLSISYIDRFLSLNVFNRQKLQLLEGMKRLPLQKLMNFVILQITHSLRQRR